MMETAQDICGMTKGPCRHKETWWWNVDSTEDVICLCDITHHHSLLKLRYCFDGPVAMK